MSATGQPGSTWNVNSWHWEEKNYTSHAKEYLNQAFSDLKVDGDVLITFTKMSKFDGDVYTNIRKGKKIVGYDFKLDLAWTATVSEGTTVSGTVHMPEVSTEVDDGDYVFDVSLDAGSTASEDDKQKVKKLVQTQGKKAAFEKINEYILKLKNAGAPERSA
jgi:activator of HSP90 ATPase